MSVSEFVALPGFFQLTRGSRRTSLETSETWWMAGADPMPAGISTGRVLWGEGSTAEDAIADWARRHLSAHHRQPIIERLHLPPTPEKASQP